MNKGLLKKIKKAIRSEPDKFDMTLYIATDPYNSCATTACIGGWAVALHGHKGDLQQARDSERFSIKMAALSALDLSEEEADLLFYVCGWPEPFQDEYLTAELAKDASKMAKAACRRIDHFMKTGK